MLSGILGSSVFSLSSNSVAVNPSKTAKMEECLSNVQEMENTRF